MVITISVRPIEERAVEKEGDISFLAATCGVVETANSSYLLTLNSLSRLSRRKPTSTEKLI